MEFFRWLFLSWEGRVHRKLYWSAVVFLCLLPTIPLIITLLVGVQLWDDWFNFYYLCAAGPLISVMVKRLHDTDHNLLWALKIFPVVGFVISLWVNHGQFQGRFREAWENCGTEKLGLQFAFTIFPFLPVFWFLINLMFVPGTEGTNRYGEDPIEKDEVHPAMSKIELAIDLIEPWVDRKFPFALSLQGQLEWCQLTLSGYGKENPKGELTLVNTAENHFDEWNEKAHLVTLLRDIEHAAVPYLSQS